MIKNFIIKNKIPKHITKTIKNKMINENLQLPIMNNSINLNEASALSLS